MNDEPDRNLPQVSVIIATYNYSSVLRYAIESVLWQTFREFELIVVGDCCTDDSEAVVRSFADPRIRWLNLPENSGSKSLPQNAGIQIARAELIAYLAHDDLWHPDHLALSVAAIAKSGADFAHTVAVYVPPAGDTERHVSGIYPGEFAPGKVLVHSSVIHRKTVFDRIGLWPDPRTTQIPGDQLFWVRAAEAGLRFYGIPKLTVWKFNASSRRDCYRLRESHEQARYFEMLRADSDLVERELIDVARSAMIHGLRPLEISKVGRDAPPGSHLQLLRQIRGLEATTSMEPLALGPESEPFRITVADQLPAVAAVDEDIELEVRLKNGSEFTLASQPPAPVYLSYHWLHSDGTTAVHEGARSILVPPLPAGSGMHYFMTVRTPPLPGVYRFQLALVQEGVRWFEMPSAQAPALEVVTPARSG